MKIFAERLKALRKERGLKQHDMALKLGLSDAGYQCYEQKKGYPEVARLIVLADFFNVSLDYLTGRSETRQRLP